MATSTSDVRKYQRACYAWGERFRTTIPVDKQLRKVAAGGDDALQTCMVELQDFLANAAAVLLYAGNSSLQQLTQADVGPDFKLGVGLVSSLQLTSQSLKDRGIPIYRFLLGADGSWGSYLKALKTKGGAISLTKIRQELIEGVQLPQRLFGHRNASGVLLAPVPLAGIDPSQRVVFPYERSGGGVASPGSQFAAEHPWALVSEISFPVLYACIMADTQAVGFLQLCMSIPPAAANDKYTGPEDTWLHIFSPKARWAQTISALCFQFCSNVLLPIVERALLLKDHHGHAVQIDFCFPRSLRRVLDLLPQNNTWTAYKDSRWGTEIAQVHSLLEHPAFSPTDLVKNTIDLLWSRDKRLETKTFGSRSEAEKLLFWNEKYREHLVHILKVFLIGERILHELYDKVPAAKEVIDKTAVPSELQQEDPKPTALQAFEHQWMLAATVHDYSLPYELLPDLQESYWREFVLRQDNSSDNPSRDLTQMQFSYALADRILRQHLVVSLWQLLHTDVCPQGRDRYKAYLDLYQLHTDTESILYPKYLSYFLEKGDHGIASALWFLHCTLLNANGKLPQKPAEEASTDAVLAVARACYFHNLATKTKAKDSPELLFNGTILKPFKYEPLGYLLLLSDVIQDEGREEGTQAGEHWSKRPMGHIEKIAVINGQLEIHLNYSWVKHTHDLKRPEMIPLGEGAGQCGKSRAISCEWRKKRKHDQETRPADDQEGLQCVGHECDDCKRIRAVLGGVLRKRLEGLPVRLVLAHDDPIELK